MSEEIERHVVRKFEICQRLGKGVSEISIICNLYLQSVFIHRHMELCGKQ